jgi:flavin-dependent dehydrogenase
VSTYIKTKYLIIGASYAGSILASKVYPYGHTLLVDKAVPGDLMNCGGGLPQKTFVKLKVNIPFVRINRILMNINGKDTSFPCRYVVVDRRKLNEALFNKALAIGVRFARMSYMSHEPDTKTATFRFREDHATVEYDKIIFADGFNPNRLRIQQKGFPDKLPCGAAKVQIIEGESKYPDTLYFKITEDNPFGYSWIFPMPDGNLNIGAGGFQTGAVPESLISNLKESENLNGKVIIRGGGLLPVLPIPNVQNADTYLFGNAAGMVYALNGEGLKHILDVSDKFAKAIIHERNLNLRWKMSLTYMKLKFASVALKALLSGSKTLNKSLYPAACRAAARSRRIIKM